MQLLRNANSEDTSTCSCSAVQTQSSWCLHACRYTIFINIAVQGSSNKAWHIAQGPLSVVFGFGLGAIAAFCCSATRLWNNKYKRVLALVISGGCLPHMHMLYACMHQYKY